MPTPTTCTSPATGGGEPAQKRQRSGAAACNGECFEQADFHVYAKKAGSGCDCSLQSCPNFAMCGQAVPAWLLGCNFGMCLNCAICVGELDILRGDAASDAKECSVCLDGKALVKLPQCTHRFCGSCAKRLICAEPAIAEEKSSEEQAVHAALATSVRSSSHMNPARLLEKCVELGISNFSDDTLLSTRAWIMAHINHDQAGTSAETLTACEEDLSDELLEDYTRCRQEALPKSVREGHCPQCRAAP
eukprot:COSAG05_NODE_3586_length_1974_cov_6.681600_2_plen_247_part_00